MGGVANSSECALLPFSAHLLTGLEHDLIVTEDKAIREAGCFASQYLP